VVFIVLIIGGAIHFLYFPQHPLYLTSVLSDQTKEVWFLYTLAKIIILVFNLYFCSVIFCILMTALFPVKTALLFTLLIVRKEFRKKKFNTVDYRGFEVFNRILLNLYGQFIFPGEALFRIMITLGSYILIRYIGNLNFPTFFILFNGNSSLAIFITLILRFGGIYAKESGKTITSWNFDTKEYLLREKKYLEKLKKSCRPLVVEYLGFYKINNKSLISFWQAVIRGILRLLLALGK
jgi:hypothetical protein